MIKQNLQGIVGVITPIGMSKRLFNIWLNLNTTQKDRETLRYVQIKEDVDIRGSIFCHIRTVNNELRGGDLYLKAINRVRRNYE